MNIPRFKSEGTYSLAEVARQLQKSFNDAFRFVIRHCIIYQVVNGKVRFRGIDLLKVFTNKKERK